MHIMFRIIIKVAYFFYNGYLTVLQDIKHETVSHHQSGYGESIGTQYHQFKICKILFIVNKRLLYFISLFCFLFIMFTVYHPFVQARTSLRASLKKSVNTLVRVTI